MKALFKPSSLRALEHHLSQPCLFIFDFDGVLAPVIATRKKAFPAPSTRALLRRLAENAEVAAVSGRGLKDLRLRLGLSTRWALGNHGFEGPPEFRAQVQEAKRSNRLWVKAFKPLQMKLPGLDLEDKRLSLSIHYHLAPDPKATRKALLAWAKNLLPSPRVVLGKNVVNLVHPKAAHKGDGVRWLLKRTGFRRAVYVGDDVTDEDVFRLADRRLFTIHVGPKLLSRAQYFIPHQKSIDRLLQLLVERTAK